MKFRPEWRIPVFEIFIASRKGGFQDDCCKLKSLKRLPSDPKATFVAEVRN